MTTPSPHTLFSFEYGLYSNSGLLIDPAGNLFGTSDGGGNYGAGMVFEIPLVNGAYASAPATLVNFNGANGQYVIAGLTSGPNGNLFGTTIAGGSSGNGNVFQITATPSGFAFSPTILVNFNGTGNGASPYAGLIADTAGNLFGTTDLGGANRDGTVFEIRYTNGVFAQTVTTLVTFNGTNGAHPIAGLTEDAAGNLFGTTQGGGAYNDGVVFEIARTATGYAGSPTVLASFNGTNGADPQGTLMIDAAGNLFGTTAIGGSYNDGTAFEIAKTAAGYASDPSTLVNFNNANGMAPAGALIADAGGNLYGTTAEGGAHGTGTVFEIVSTAGGGYASTPVTLFSFNGTSDGGYPGAGLAADAAGNLFGTTDGGGNNGYGTVFELTNTGFQQAAPLAISGGPANAAITDQQTATPFAGITITDPNAGKTEYVTVILSAAANGTLRNLGGGSYNAATGVYTVSGSAASVTTALNGLVFAPTPFQAAPSLTVTTSLTLSDTDTAGATAKGNPAVITATATSPGASAVGTTLWGVAGNGASGPPAVLNTMTFGTSVTLRRPVTVGPDGAIRAAGRSLGFSPGNGVKLASQVGGPGYSAATSITAFGQSAPPVTMSTSVLANSSPDGDVITVTSSDQLIDPGTGNHSIQFAIGTANDVLVLRDGGTDQISGFDPAAGDGLDLSALFAAAGVNTASALFQAANYVSVAGDGQTTRLLFDPTGHGGGAAVAVLPGSLTPAAILKSIAV